VLSLTAGGLSLLDTRLHQFVIGQGSYSNTGSANFPAVDATGQHLLISNGAIADQSGAVLGILPAHNSAVMRSDGQTAVILAYDGLGVSHIAIVNTASAMGPASIFPEVGADIPVSPSLGRPESNGYGDAALQLVLSADGHTAFVSGPDNVVAIALP